MMMVAKKHGKLMLMPKQVALVAFRLMRPRELAGDKGLHSWAHASSEILLNQR